MPQPSVAQNERDFIFADEEGHLVLRYAGAATVDLNPHDLDEIVNSSLSNMVHDRLQADVRFDAEPVDSGWAAWMEPKIESELDQSWPDISATEVECRSASCRIMLQLANRLDVAEHQALMGIVQRDIRSFIEANATSFQPVFLLAGYDQEAHTPLIKVYLQRAEGKF